MVLYCVIINDSNLCHQIYPRTQALVLQWKLKSFAANKSIDIDKSEQFTNLKNINIDIDKIEQFTNFMLHFTITLLKICFVSLPPPMTSNSTSLVTFKYLNCQLQKWIRKTSCLCARINLKLLFMITLYFLLKFIKCFQAVFVYKKLNNTNRDKWLFEFI